MASNKNIFVDFEIIINSDQEKLKTELDILIVLKNKVYVWSKEYLPQQMKEYCSKKVIPISKEEFETHLKIRGMRVQKKSFKEISEATKVPVWKISFYLKNDPDKPWTLDDWIVDYYKKDSSVYSKVDFLIDPNPKLVQRFERIGIPGTIIEKL